MAHTPVATILPDPTQVELVRLTETTAGITAIVRARAASTLCPVCGTRSERVPQTGQKQAASTPQG